MHEDLQKRKLPLWSALASLLIGYLWVCCFWAGFSIDSVDFVMGFPLDGIHDAYPLLFTVVFFLWSGMTLRGKEANREHFVWLLCALGVACAMALRRCHAVDGWQTLVLHGFAAYWVLCRGGMLAEGKTGMFAFWDLLETFLFAPFGGFFLRIITIFTGIRDALIGSGKKSANWKGISLSALVILMALPAFLLVGNLLGQADALFGQVYASISGLFSFSVQSPQWVEDFLLRYLLGLPVGAYLFGLVGTVLRENGSRLDAQRFRDHVGEGIRFAPKGGLVAVFGGFICLYLLFFAVQARHLCGAFFGNVPGTMTAAQYAREGFFQLCQVMGINFALLFAVWAMSKVSLREEKTLRTLASILMVQSLLLAVTAAAKLGLYISRFGFTPLRLLSVWGIGVLSCGCVFTLISLRKSWGGFRNWAYFAAITFTLLCFY